MNLYEQIIAIYPELLPSDFNSFDGCIRLRDDSDGLGAYITQWEYSKPLPKGFKVGK